MNGAWTSVVASPLALTLFIGAGFDEEVDAAPETGINVSALPGLARQLLPELTQDLRAACPELPTLWVLAETQAESGWNPDAFSSAAAAGLLQLTPATWVAAGGAGGAWSRSTRPLPRHPVWNPSAHLQVAVRWMCGNLQ